MSPTLSPTKSPSAEPTVNPTNDPTTEPTYNPTWESIFCSNLSVMILNIESISSDKVQSDIQLQKDMGNMTEFAILQNAQDNGMDGDTFDIIYENVSGSPRYKNGQILFSIFVDQLLCSGSMIDLQVLSLIIHHEKYEIAALFKTKLVAQYPEEAMSVLLI